MLLRKNFITVHNKLFHFDPQPLQEVSWGRTFSSEPGGLQQLHHVLHLYQDVRPVTLHNHIRQRWQEVIPAHFLPCKENNRRQSEEFVLTPPPFNWITDVL